MTGYLKLPVFVRLLLQEAHIGWHDHCLRPPCTLLFDSRLLLPSCSGSSDSRSQLGGPYLRSIFQRQKTAKHECQSRPMQLLKPHVSVANPIRLFMT